MVNFIKNNKILDIAKIVLFVLIAGIVIKEFGSILKSFDVNLFLKYANELSFVNVLIILALGIISYIPLSFYDFVLKSRANINLPNKKLYKLSWIISSISSIAGFGGSTAIFLKSNLYKDYIEDKNLLIKESSRIFALNFTGFSMVCLIYAIFNIGGNFKFNLINVLIYGIALYLPCLIGYLTFKYIKTKDKQNTIDSIKIMSISILEWITTIILIVSIFAILKTNLSVFKIFPVFVLAITASVLGMTPGGIGTFDVTMIIGLEALGVPSEKVLLALFLYRISYYIVPLLIGLGLYAHELNNFISTEAKELIKVISSKFSYYILVISIFICGILAIALPTYNYLNINNKIDVSKMMYFEELSNDLSIILGIILLILSKLLWNKNKSIYKLTLTALTLFMLTAMYLNFRYTEILFLVLVIAILIASKKEFYRVSYVIKRSQILRLILVMISSYFMYQLCFSGGKLDVFEILLPCVCIALFIVTIMMTIAYFRNRKSKINRIKLEDCEDDIIDIIKRFGGTPYTHYVYLNDKKIYINKEKDVFFQFEIYEDKLFVLGPPIGNKDNLLNAIDEFYNMADSYGYTPIFCAVDNSTIPHLHSIGYHFIKVGEDSSVDLENFTLEGRKMKSVRNAISRVEKEGYSFEIVNPPFSDSFLDELKSISDKWLGNRKELNFTVGKFDKKYLEYSPIAIIKNKEGEIKGFSNLMPMYDNNETLSIDLMRFNDTCNGIMDFIFVNLFIYAKENGYKKFNMGLAPLSNVGESKHAFLNERIAQQLYTHSKKIYSFEGLKRFKEKYCTLWEPRYFAYRKNSNILGIIISFLLMIYLPNKDKSIDSNISSSKDV